MSAEAVIRELHALRVRPDEVLILRVARNALPPEDLADALAQLREALDEVGLVGRSLVVAGDVEFAIAEAAR